MTADKWETVLITNYLYGCDLLVAWIRDAIDRGLDPIDEGGQFVLNHATRLSPADLVILYHCSNDDLVAALCVYHECDEDSAGT